MQQVILVTVDIGVDAILPLLAVWLAAGPLMTGLQILHAMREKVVTGLDRDKARVSAVLEWKYCRAMLWNSYVPLWAGYLIFLLMVVGFAYALPAYDYVSERFHRFICYAVVFQFGISFIGFLVGGIRDIGLMQAAIAERRPRDHKSA